MRAQVLRETGLTVSAGVSPNRKLSKIAADFNKPNGQYVIAPSRQAMMSFMHPLPIRKIPGVGRVTERYLQSLGVNTVADIYRLRGRLMLVKNEVGLDFLLRAYLGLGGTEIAEPGQRNQKGIGVERTFKETTDVAFFRQKLRTIAESLADDMASSEYAGRTLTLKVKWASYQLISRGKTLGPSIYFNDLPTIWHEAKKLFELALLEEKKRLKGAPPKLRLIGLRMSNLRDEKEGRQGGKLDGFVKTTKPPTASRFKQKLKEEPEGEEDVDPQEDDEAQLTLPLHSQEDDILDLARSTPEPYPPPADKPAYDYLAASRKSMVNTAAYDPTHLAGRPLGPSSATVTRDRKREEEAAASARAGRAPPTTATIESQSKPTLDHEPEAGPSSDALWESFGDAMLDAPAYTYADQVEREALAKSGKLQAMQTVRENSSWGAATQVKRELEREAIVKREASQSPRKRKEQREAVECPVCGKSFVGSEVALNAHVEAHFLDVDVDEPRAKKSRGVSTQPSARVPDKKPVVRAEKAREKGVKSTLDGFWKK